MTRELDGGAPEAKEATAEIPGRDLAAARELAAEEAAAFYVIGRFVVEFSQLDFTIKVLLASRLGLAEDLFDIVIAPYDFAVLCKRRQRKGMQVHRTTWV